MIQGNWITDAGFIGLEPIHVFHRELDTTPIPESREKNVHLLFRRHLTLENRPKKAVIAITADDYYKLYVNGVFVGQGPAADYVFHYGYDEYDLSSYLREGENVIAVHTFYQGLINRVWVSGDNRHGLLLSLDCDGKTICVSDGEFLCRRHTGYTSDHLFGYATQFNENYDSSCPEDRFYEVNFDDGDWEHALINPADDHVITHRNPKTLTFESHAPVSVTTTDNSVIADFGGIFVGYPSLSAHGEKGDVLTIYCGQELSDDGHVRHKMRCNCDYVDSWKLSGKDDVLLPFDYKSFRYVEITGKIEALNEITLVSRHYPFTLNASLKKEYAEDETLRAIWKLCVNSQKHGVQEVIQDCMDREKGFYLGDGCYSALTHLILTGDDSMARKLIDDGFRSAFVTDGLLTCADCSFCQEIAEYPLMLISFILWHYRLSGDKDYLRQNYVKSCAILDAYRRDYEKENLLRDLDKWCVVEWPANFRDGYAVDVEEGKICTEPHVSINAYYLNAVRTANEIASILSLPPYRDDKALYEAFIGAFYDKEAHAYVDGLEHRHISYIGNLFPFAFGLYPDEEFVSTMLGMIAEKGLHSTSFFTSFLLLQGLMRTGHGDRIPAILKDDGAYCRMLREDATRTFEGWGRDTKWNTSLYHLTLSLAAVFMAEGSERIFG